MSPGYNKALYLVIADSIMDEILNGSLKPDDRLLSIRDYAARVQVNHNTVVRAYDYLSEQQLIYNRRGMGFYVAEDAPVIVERLRRKEVCGVQLEEIFRQLSMLDVSPDELRDYYQRYLNLSSQP